MLSLDILRLSTVFAVHFWSFFIPQSPEITNGQAKEPTKIFYVCDQCLKLFMYLELFDFKNFTSIFSNSAFLQIFFSTSIIAPLMTAPSCSPVAGTDFV